MPDINTGIACSLTITLSRGDPPDLPKCAAFNRKDMAFPIEIEAKPSTSPKFGKNPPDGEKIKNSPYRRQLVKTIADKTSTLCTPLAESDGPYLGRTLEVDLTWNQSP